MIIPPPLRAITSPHRAALEAEFGPLRPTTLAMPDQKYLFLCFTNRCGSNYLAHLLATTGAFNEAGEFFNANTVLEYTRPRALRSFAEYFVTITELLPHYGHMAMKTGIDQLAMLADAGILDALGPRAHFLLLERADRLGQAISRVIATQTGRFFSHQPATIPDSALTYSRTAIETELQKTAHANALFYAFFAANGITPIHTTYEAVLADPTPILTSIATVISSAPLTAHPEAIRIERQATALNDAWRASYLAGR